MLVVGKLRDIVFVLCVGVDVCVFIVLCVCD